MELSELGLSTEQMELVKKAIQSETDKVRTDYSTKLKVVNEEIAKYKPAEKTDSELALEERQKELDQKENEIANKERGYQLKEKLASNGLPADLAKYLNVGEDIDSFIQEVSGTLNNHFLGNGYTPTNHSKSEGVTKEQFKKMSYSERAFLLETSPELYKALSN